VHALLLANAMTDAESDEGRKLLMAVLGGPSASATPAPLVDAAQSGAQAELDQWDEPNFTRFDATLTRHFPALRD
jgi:hypothetical protein